MTRFDLLQVDRIKFKLVLAEEWARNQYMRHIFFSKNFPNTKTQSFADIYTIRILNKGNNHSSPALL